MSLRNIDFAINCPVSVIALMIFVFVPILFTIVIGKPIDINHSPSTAASCNISHQILSELYRPKQNLDRVRSGIINITSLARNQANHIKGRFVAHSGESDLEEGLKSNRKEWMPNHYDLRNEISSSNEVSEMVKSIHKYMVFYVNKWSEIVQNRSRYQVDLLQEFDQIFHLSEGLLCEITLIASFIKDYNGVATINIDSVRLPIKQSSRMIYEYIVLRDYIQTLELILNLFKNVDISRLIDK